MLAATCTFNVTLAAPEPDHWHPPTPKGVGFLLRDDNALPQECFWLRLHHANVQLRTLNRTILLFQDQLCLLDYCRVLLDGSKDTGMKLRKFCQRRQLPKRKAALIFY